MTMVNLMTMMMTTCMIKLRMMVGPGKVDGQHVACYPVVEEPQQQRLPGVPDDDEERDCGGGGGDVGDDGDDSGDGDDGDDTDTWLQGFLLVQKPGCQGLYRLKIKPGCEG